MESCPQVWQYQSCMWREPGINLSIWTSNTHRHWSTTSNQLCYAYAWLHQGVAKAEQQIGRNAFTDLDIQYLADAYCIDQSHCRTCKSTCTYTAKACSRFKLNSVFVPHHLHNCGYGSADTCLCTVPCYIKHGHIFAAWTGHCMFLECG